MHDVEINAFFCEDVRAEDNGKPIFLGVLSPILMVEDLPYEMKELYYVSMFYVAPHVNEFDASLEVYIESGDGKTTVFESSKHFKRSDQSDKEACVSGSMGFNKYI
jgi:hypothetical protein